jgi:hypothetical protein
MDQFSLIDKAVFYVPSYERLGSLTVNFLAGVVLL